jgi:hypothetical protein
MDEITSDIEEDIPQTFKTTNNPNLDLFIQLVRDVNKDQLINYLNKSWEQDKLKTVAIIFNSRDRLKGKKEKTVSNYCLIWLKEKDPVVYKANLETYINKYGCWKDVNYIINNTKKNNFEYELFANQLKYDKACLEMGQPISLCAKWAINPNEKNVIKIVKHLFPQIKDYQQKYRKEYISPLRKKLDLVETKMCNKQWELIEYEKLPAKALSKYKKAFIKNDQEKYQEFLKNVAENKVKLKVTGLLPHEIVKKYIDLKSRSFKIDEVDETLELEWKAFLNTFDGKEFEGIIPIVDISGSMFNSAFQVKPIYVSVALGLLLAHINKDFLHNKVITFSKDPKFFTIEGETLSEKITSIMKSPFGLNTDFIKVADMIIENNLTSYKKIICFTDMQFDKSANENNETSDMKNSHTIFMNKFIEKGLNIPELIYWNLNGTYNDFPIDNTYENTSIISGFSEQLLNVILENNDKITPEILMENILQPYYEHILI